jgi:hypothetical protein
MGRFVDTTGRLDTGKRLMRLPSPDCTFCRSQRLPSVSAAGWIHWDDQGSYNFPRARWSALQDVAFLDEEGNRKIWSESHVSEGKAVAAHAWLLRC